MLEGEREGLLLPSPPPLYTHLPLYTSLEGRREEEGAVAAALRAHDTRTTRPRTIALHDALHYMTRHTHHAPQNAVAHVMSAPSQRRAIVAYLGGNAV